MKITAPSADHAALGGVSAAQHHTKYTDANAVAAVIVDTAHIENNAVTGAKLNPSLVLGDIIYADGTDTIARLGKGSETEVLTMGGSNAPTWEARGRPVAGDTDNGIITWVTSDNTFAAEAALTYDGTTLTIPGQIAFPSTQAASAGANVMDEYEEGTWQPQLGDNSSDGTGESQAYSQQVGTYTRVGRLVSIQCVLETSDVGTLTAGEMVRILGLPFPASNITNLRQSFAVGRATGLNLAAAGQSACFATRAGISFIESKVWDATGGTSNFLISEWSDSGRIELSGTYIV
jgi:hypothetical protein